MTGAEKRRITLLRRQGMNYQDVAEAMGMPTSTIRVFCWRNDLTDRTLSAPPVKKSDTCIRCGVPIRQTPCAPPKKFCGDACRFAWWRENRDKMCTEKLITLVCPQCGKEFDRYCRKGQKYCSHQCYIKHRFWQEDS